MRRRAHWLPLLAFALAAFAVPLVLSGNRYFAFVAGITLISVTWATGMNLLYGYTGLMPLMFAGIAGISAYVTVGLASAGWSFWIAMLAGSLAASLAGVLLGLPSLRLRGFYFTLCSLVIQTVITLAFVFFINLTNGDTGISQIPLPEIPGGMRLTGVAYDLVLAAVAVIGVVVLALIVESPFGRRLIAIREDDGLAETLGIDVTRQKLLAFFIASLFASVGGAPFSGGKHVVDGNRRISFGALVQRDDAVLGLNRETAFLGENNRLQLKITPDGHPLFSGGLVVKRLWIDLASLGQRSELLLSKRPVRFGFGGGADVEFLRGHVSRIWLGGGEAASVLSPDESKRASSTC